MKTLFVSLVALLFAFFLGCQSSITDPVVTENQSTVSQEEQAYKDAASVFPGLIKLEGSIFDPVHTLFGVQISGVVKYNLEIVGTSDPYRLKASIYVNADLKSGCPGLNQNWKVYGLTQDILSGPTKILEKSYVVRNTSGCHYRFIMRFKVNKQAVTLISMELDGYNEWSHSVNHY